MQIKTTGSYHLTPIGMSVIKGQDIANTGEDMEERETGRVRRKIACIIKQEPDRCTFSLIFPNIPSVLCFIDYAKAFDCVDHNNLWKTPKEMGIPDHLTCFSRNLYAGQEETVRTGRGIRDWF